MTDSTWCSQDSEGVMVTPRRVMDGRLKTLLPLEVMSSCGGGSLPNEHCVVPHFMWLSVVNLLMPSIACCNRLVGGVRGRMTRQLLYRPRTSTGGACQQLPGLPSRGKQRAPPWCLVARPQVVKVRSVMWDDNRTHCCLLLRKSAIQGSNSLRTFSLRSIV